MNLAQARFSWALVTLPTTKGSLRQGYMRFATIGASLIPTTVSTIYSRLSTGSAFRYLTTHGQILLPDLTTFGIFGLLPSGYSAA